MPENGPADTGQASTGQASTRTVRGADPYPNYRWLREHQPVSQVERGDGSRLCVVTSYELVRSCLVNPRLRSGYEDPSDTQHAPGAAVSRSAGMSVGISDKYHERIYQIMSDVFPASLVERARPAIQATCRAALATFAERGHAELMGEYALPIPVTVIHDLLGVPPQLREAPEVCLDNYLRGGFTDPPDGAALAFLDDYAGRLIAYKQAHPGDDVSTALLGYLDRGELQSRDELQAILFTLIGAGHTTTAPFIATSVVRLLEHPDYLAAALQDDDRWQAAAEEVLRHDAPLHSVQTRYAQEQVTIGDIELQPGDAVLLSLAAANRDPARFENPEDFDPSRPTPRHLAFGHGPHFCPGSQLARGEGVIAVRELFRALPDLALAIDPGDIEWAFGPVLRGPAAVPVTFTPRPGERA